MEMTTISALLTSLKAATDIAKFIRESDISFERAELRLKLAELVEALANAKLEAADVQQSMRDRDEIIRELREAAKIRAQMKWIKPCYYMPNEQGLDEPFCQKLRLRRKALALAHRRQGVLSMPSMRSPL